MQSQRTAAVNIIDGLNGLHAGTCVAALMAVVMQLGTATPSFGWWRWVSASTVGFLLLNYPRGLLFLGDGGAYLLGAGCGFGDHPTDP